MSYGLPSKGSGYSWQTISRLAESAPTAYQVLEWAGIQTRRARRRRLAAHLGWLSAGLAFGSGVAVLLTPRTGPELQRELGRRLKSARDWSVAEARDLRDGLHQPQRESSQAQSL